ncbi:PcfJ domain-containing protein [Candidatus Pacearchaeota archaeon]|jgi:hypothetical protein|nr:PcfJ domain-containing protein [Candidatus Pacearchaeota archaeon]
MKRSNRAATRDWVNEQRAQERARKLRLEEEEAKKLALVQAAIAKNNKQKSPLEEWDLESNEFWITIEKRAPRLFDSDYIGQLRLVSVLEHHRPIADWEPRGKGKTTIFNSLCDHLLAKFPTPPFIWSAFWELDVIDVIRRIGRAREGEQKPDAEGRYVDIEFSPIIQAIVRIARGDSFAKMCKSGDFPVTLTNKQCHQFLASNSESTFLSALRRTQIQTWGGDNRLLRVLMNRENGRRLAGIVDETFLDSVIAWFSKNPMLDLEQFSPIMDFIWTKRFEDKKFSMKGRSAMAIMRAMEDWHQDLAKRKIVHGKEYKSSGFKSGHYEFNHREPSGNYVQCIYDITEILNSKELHAEGKAQRHCVLSYSGSIEQGYCSIWSMKVNGERAITIEVRSRSIVQARGHCNRKASSEEFKIMQRWATENGFEIRLPSWG